jgi:two-component system aerobic respiration control sensor histidine kinase ArcB
MRKVLLIEDDAMVQIVIGGMLEALDCAVDLADSGAKALALCKNHSYDIIFLDLGLPDIEGFELAPKLIAGGFDGPIIACTGRTALEASERCFNAGIKGFLQKPASLDTLRETLNTYLKVAA